MGLVVEGIVEKDVSPAAPGPVVAQLRASAPADVQGHGQGTAKKGSMHSTCRPVGSHYRL